MCTHLLYILRHLEIQLRCSSALLCGAGQGLTEAGQEQRGGWQSVATGGGASEMQQVRMQGTQPEHNSFALLGQRGMFLNPCQAVGQEDCKQMLWSSNSYRLLFPWVSRTATCDVQVAEQHCLTFTRHMPCQVLVIAE